MKGSQHVTDPPDSQKNFLVVDQKTETSTIEGAFDSFTKQRKDIAIVLINQHVRHGEDCRIRTTRDTDWWADCGQDKREGGCLQRSFPVGVGDSEQRPPV